MNIDKLRQAEALFLQRYPQGFDHPDMVEVGKKHRMDKMIGMSRDAFKKSRFRDSAAVADDMVRVISRSSMVSMFEKPKFRDLISVLSGSELKALTNGLRNFLHGNQEKGFDAIVDAMIYYKLAKWSLVTIIPNYYHPDDEVFVKPTTVKGAIEYFELDGIHYHPTPTWDFYQRYREAFLEMKAQVDESLAPSNAAFGGFLMMSMHG